MLLCASACAQDSPRDAIYRILHTDKVLDANREVMHLAKACSLQLASRAYPVINIPELVKGALLPRGVNRIVMLDAGWRPVQSIAYTTQRPLFCLDNKLFVYGDLTIGHVAPQGNVLTFLQGRHNVTVSHVEAND